jgi:hypothetical protein
MIRIVSVSGQGAFTLVYAPSCGFVTDMVEVEKPIWSAAASVARRRFGSPDSENAKNPERRRCRRTPNLQPSFSAGCYTSLGLTTKREVFSFLHLEHIFLWLGLAPDM